MWRLLRDSGGGADRFEPRISTPVGSTDRTSTIHIVSSPAMSLSEENGTVEKSVSIRGVDQPALLGFNDANLDVLEHRYAVVPIARGDEIILRGAERDVDELVRIVKEMIYLVERNGSLVPSEVEAIVDLVTGDHGGSERTGLRGDDIDDVILFANKSVIKAKGERQNDYVRKVRENDIVFATGPAGTGKTYLAVAMAVAAYRNRDVTRIILTRPAVEAGESLGFLPGDLREKIDPYLRPLYDALEEMIPAEKLKAMAERRAIEVAPLAFMRGRTLNHAYVILDEAQNTTALQMKMFLTRLGASSRAIVTGDLTQTDLPGNVESGLVQATSILRNIDGIEFVEFEKGDVVRHRLVKEIIRAYEDRGVTGGL